MGKKKNKNKQQKPAFKPRPPNPVMVVANRNLNRPTAFRNVSSGPTRFQAPHHQQESMVELSDDTSPNTPLAITTGGWKPVQSLSTTAKSTPNPEIKITRQEQTWREFKGALAKPIHKIGEKSKEEKSAKSNVKQTNTKPTEPKKAQSSSEIKWELNVLDDKEDTVIDISDDQDVTIPVSNPPTPQVDQVAATQTKPPQSKDKRTPAQKHDEPTTPSSNNAPAYLPRDTPQPRHVSSQEKDATIAMMYMTGSYPKGVPKSFLRQQNNVGSIEPQYSNQNPNAFWNPGFYEDPSLHINTAPPKESMESPVEEQQYSPSDVYDSGVQVGTEEAEGSISPEGSGHKRLSAFRRLGPVSQPKKPKLTINLLCNQDQSIREVLEDEVETYTPVHLRKDIIESSDETVMKYLPQWPWKRHVTPRKKVTARNSKSVMILEQEQMEEWYEKDNVFIQVSVKGYPPFWKKEHVLDVILDAVKGKSFIPCFIEFTAEECKFLVNRCRSALVAIHKLGFYIRKDDVELGVSIYQVDLSLKQIEFIPRLVLRKQLAVGYDGERKLSLKEFTLKSDVSHFIYFPLNRGTNQTELVQLQSTVAWDFLTDLDLSNNRLTSIDGFELPKTTPKLKHLDLSNNWIDKVTCLLYNRDLSLRSLKLEGNPLCHDYIDPGHYVRVVKMIFPALMELDGVKIHLKGDIPQTKRNYCPPDAVDVVNKFLEVFFPLLEAPADERSRIEDMYHDNAVLTVTYRYSLRYSAIHRKFRNIFLRARVFDEGDAESIEGAVSVTRLLAKWPMMFHDPYTFTVDVIHHSIESVDDENNIRALAMPQQGLLAVRPLLEMKENSTILRIDGILKLTSETLAEDEYLLAFTRTLVLNTVDGVEYKIMNEMVYWDDPSRELANTAFQFNTIRTSKRLSLKFDSVPDEETKTKLTEIFMKITDLDKKSSERCLEMKEWNLKTSVEYFMKLVKLDDLSSLRKELEMDRDLI